MASNETRTGIVATAREMIDQDIDVLSVVKVLRLGVGLAFQISIAMHLQRTKFDYGISDGGVCRARTTSILNFGSTSAAAQGSAPKARHPLESQRRGPNIRRQHLCPGFEAGI
jgi:hypothetical protein